MNYCKKIRTTGFNVDSKRGNIKASI